MPDDTGHDLALETSCYIDAPPQRVFDAWTTPAELLKWWGPADVNCVAAEVDLRVGGRYRIANEMPDKSVLWIRGTFEQVAAPRRLVYSWQSGDDAGPPERVSVAFDPEARGTRITVRHERIAHPTLRDRHRHGWNGCLAGLSRHLEKVSGLFS